jgi:hypothetical protein
MKTSNLRNNAYWTNRLKKDGHEALLDRVQAGDITVYKATQLAGYRKPGPRTPAAKLSYHWQRASAEERKRFIRHHLVEINRVGKEALAEIRAEKAQKPSE